MRPEAALTASWKLFLSGESGSFAGGRIWAELFPFGRLPIPAECHSLGVGVATAFLTGSSAPAETLYQQDNIRLEGAADGHRAGARVRGKLTDI